MNDSYLVRTFTVESADGNKKTVPAITNSTYYRNYSLEASGATYNLTFNNLDFQGTGSAISHWGLFLHLNQTNANLTINLNNVSFTNYKGAVSNGHGGVIESKSPATINGSNVSFTQNEGTSGGAIELESGNLTLKIGGSLSFDHNAAIGKYDASTPRHGSGGAIGIINGSVSITDAQEVSFTYNTGTNAGGAIYFTQNATIEATTINFSNNSSTYLGGAIHGHGTGMLSIEGNSITFANNTAGTSGGAIQMAKGGRVSITGKGDNPVITFEENSASSDGGAICSPATFTTGKFSFKNNTSSSNGGAFFGRYYTFTGDNTSATFSGNKAAATKSGNDIYIFGESTDNSGNVLNFYGKGTYSFDGGIFITANAGIRSNIDEAQVTIAGRENDTTNKYQLQDVYISNGGKLTANLDYIDSLTGTFNVSGATEETKGTLNLNVSENVVKKLNADSFKVVRTDLGEVVKTGDGTLQLCNESQDLIDINGLVVSSGRMDILGYMTGGITVEPNSVFSPGNSVGDARFGGGYELKEGATLLIEQEDDRIDTLTASSFVIDSNSIIDIVADSLQPGAEYPIIVNSTGAFSGDLQNDNFWNGLLTSGSDYYWNLSVRGDTVYASVDANAVPEPSTWALLILGAAGLLYVRKRTQK